MSPSSHTPGPWTVGYIKQSNRPDANFPIEAFYDADGKRFRATVAEIPTWSFDGVTDANREEHIANASLIAAAPDLYAALLALLEDHRRMFTLAHPMSTIKWSACEEVKAACAAIARAEGKIN